MLIKQKLFIKYKINNIFNLLLNNFSTLLFNLRNTLFKIPARCTRISPFRGTICINSILGVNLLSTNMSARQNFSKASEDAINEQINAELTASYVYKAMAAHFDRDDVALPGFRDYFLESSKEENEHAQEFIDYVNKRGGRVTYKPIVAPVKIEWTTALDAVEDALALEKEVNEKLLKLHAVADAENDPQLADWLESEFLEEQVEANKKLADLITQLKRVGEGLGVYLIDKDLKH